MPKQRKKNDADTPALAIKNRLQYVCELLYGGRCKKFAEAVGCRDAHYFKRVVYGSIRPTPAFLSQIVKSGVANAEFLLCGTGPVTQLVDAGEKSFDLAEQFHSQISCFDTTQLQYSDFRRRFTREFEPVTPDISFVSDIARTIYSVRGRGGPVVLYLNEAFLLAGAGSHVVSLLTQKYVTAVVCTLRAAYRDLELARFGSCASKAEFQVAFQDFNRAAFVAAANGLGYGDVIARWCYEKKDRKEQSVVFNANNLGVPVFIHGALGDIYPHWFPAKNAAALGAAFGAAIYTDMLLFTEYLRNFCVSRSGVFISADGAGVSFFDSAAAALGATDPLFDSACSDIFQLDIRATVGELKNVFPSLLGACVAVYDGSA